MQLSIRLVYASDYAILDLRRLDSCAIQEREKLGIVRFVFGTGGRYGFRHALDVDQKARQVSSQFFGVDGHVLLLQ